MPLDPQVQAAVAALAAAGFQPAHLMTVEEARQVLIQSRVAAGEPEPVHQVTNRLIPGPGGDLPVRIYTPSEAGPLPVLVFFHGGGWIRGNLETHDGICRSLANQAECLVVSVDYRLSPEVKFPAAVEDCFAATRWVFENAASLKADPARIAVGGDSAGGQLAAAVTLLARGQDGLSLCFQLLVYPVTDYSFDTPSYQENATGYVLTRDAMKWYWDLFLASPEDGLNPLASPLRAKDLSGLPPALVITAEYDPLRDEGRAYADRLRDAGVPVSYRCYEGVIHGFVGMLPPIDKGQQALVDMAATLRSSFTEVAARV